MKKIKLLFLTIILFSLTGCVFNNDSMEDINIVTSYYPVEYVVKYLYGDHSTISSIYPKDDDASSFKVTNTLLKQYSDTDLFIFDGASNEKNYVKKMIKYNADLKIIDISSNMEVENSYEELWLDPNNLLTIANNIKKGFDEYIQSTYLTDEVDENYENLKIELTSLDGNYYSTVKNSSIDTIIVSDDAFKYLEKYGLTVISLDEDTVDQKTKNEANELLDSGKCKHIFIKYKEDNDYIKSLGVDTLELYTMTNLYGVDTEKSNYITLMNQNLEQLKLELFR